jgi:hypothetical protein
MGLPEEWAVGKARQCTVDQVMMVVVDLMEDSGMALLLLPDTAAVPDMAGHLLDVTGEEVALQAEYPL